MASAAVFYKLVNKEDDYTQLLCNLMQRNADFRNRVLRLFLSEESASEIKPNHIRTQCVLPECGRPDIVIQTPSLCALVEVKINPKRALSPNQEPAPYGQKELKGYVRFLQGCKVREKWMVFLVPQDWKYREELQRMLLISESKYPHIKSGLIFWEEIVQLITIPTDSDQFLKGFQELLVRFAPIMFSEEEVQLIFSKNFPLRGVLKLQRLIKQVGERAKKKKGYSVKFVTDSQESGFYLMKDKVGFFWCGIWADAGERDGQPFCFGVSDDDVELMPSLRNAFCEAYKGTTKRIGDYTLGWIPQKTLEGDQSLEKVWARLEPVLAKVHKAANNGKGRH